MNDALADLPLKLQAPDSAPGARCDAPFGASPKPASIDQQAVVLALLAPPPVPQQQQLQQSLRLCFKNRTRHYGNGRSPNRRT